MSRAKEKIMTKSEKDDGWKKAGELFKKAVDVASEAAGEVVKNAKKQTASPSEKRFETLERKLDEALERIKVLEGRIG